MTSVGVMVVLWVQVAGGGNTFVASSPDSATGSSTLEHDTGCYRDPGIDRFNRWLRESSRWIDPKSTFATFLDPASMNEKYLNMSFEYKHDLLIAAIKKARTGAIVSVTCGTWRRQMLYQPVQRTMLHKMLRWNLLFPSLKDLKQWMNLKMKILMEASSRQSLNTSMQSQLIKSELILCCAGI